MSQRPPIPSERHMENAKNIERLISSYEHPEKVYEKVGDLLKGIPIEYLFMGISVWSGECEIIHRLDQSQFPKRDRKLYQVPDLLAIYRFNGKRIPVLIEVKSIQKKPYKLRISQKDYHRRTRYAKETGLPLLFAIFLEKFGSWAMVDASTFEKKKQSYHLSFVDAAINNLMGVLMNETVFIVPKELLRVKEYRQGINKVGIRHPEYGVLMKEHYIFKKNEQEFEPTDPFPVTMRFVRFTETDIQKMGNVTKVYSKPFDTFIFLFTIFQGLEKWFRESFKKTTNWKVILEKEKFLIDREHLESVLLSTRSLGISPIKLYPQKIPEWLKNRRKS